MAKSTGIGYRKQGDGSVIDNPVLRDGDTSTEQPDSFEQWQQERMTEIEELRSAARRWGNVYEEQAIEAGTKRDESIAQAREHTTQSVLALYRKLDADIAKARSEYEEEVRPFLQHKQEAEEALAEAQLRFFTEARDMWGADASIVLAALPTPTPATTND